MSKEYECNLIGLSAVAEINEPSYHGVD